MKIWKSHVGWGLVRLTDTNTIEIVYGNSVESPCRLICGRVVYLFPSHYPNYLKLLVKKVFDTLWDDKKPANNDHMPLYAPPPPIKKKKLSLKW